MKPALLIIHSPLDKSTIVGSPISEKILYLWPSQVKLSKKGLNFSPHLNAWVLNYQEKMLVPITLNGKVLMESIKNVPRRDAIIMLFIYNKFMYDFQLLKMD